VKAGTWGAFLVGPRLPELIGGLALLSDGCHRLLAARGFFYLFRLVFDTFLLYV
jgi:hypothetical protein